ncbi:hypothetical protein [Neolewinella sp.]|uniref:hypothetical protein n=1 Tax=Neolewinella sp. TaxID=2993543 RepID=UPI003B51B1F6
MHLSTQFWRYLLLITFIAVPIVNYLPFFTGGGQRRFADDASTRVDAAGYAFSIWGLIFAGMLVFAALQLRNTRKTRALKRGYQFLVLAGLASIAFVPISMGNDQVLGAGDLLWHLGALLGAYFALRDHEVESKVMHYGWTYLAPSVYLGWISAATVISLALALNQLGLEVAPDTAIYIATALVGVLTALGAYLSLRQDNVYTLTVAWALVAVAVEQRDAALIFWGACAGAALLVGLSGWAWLGPRKFFYAR